MYEGKLSFLLAKYLVVGVYLTFKEIARLGLADGSVGKVLAARA